MDLSKIRGNLGLKSSALAPTACKLSSQFLVLDHMSNHYTKIARAKSAIDSRPPKSLMASQKMRDRMNRSRFLGSPRPHSHASLSGTVLNDYEDVLKDEPEDEEEKLVHSIMRSTLLEKSRSSNNATHGADLHMDAYQQEHMSTNLRETSPYGADLYIHPGSAHSVRSGHSLASSPSRVALATSLLRRTCIGDVLEKRPHLFTEPERPFTPRTLKKNTESRLKNSKCYTPPRNKSAKKENREAGTDKNNKNKTEQNYSKETINNFEKGRIQNKKMHSKMKDNQRPEFDLGATNGPAKLSSSMLMDISLRSRDEAYNQEANTGVPPLAITMDKDHMNWLQEQASKAEIRVRSSGRLKSSLHSDEELHSVSRYPARESDLHMGFKMEKQRKDEEQKYLTFAKEVTDDVLSRGISSDIVLDKVFENHIVRHKDDLDEDRMRKVISDLRTNLGLKDSFTREQASASLSDTSYNNRSEKEHTTYNNNRSEKEHKTYNKSSRSRNSNYMNSDPGVNSTFNSDIGVISAMNSDLGVNSTLESVNSLKFGQTGDFLSTINSEASLEKKKTEKRLGDDNQMALSQTLRDYQLSLTDKEEIDDNLRESENHNVAQENTLKHSNRQPKPARSGRRMAREGRLNKADGPNIEQTSSIDKSLGTSAQDSYVTTSPQNSHVTNDEDTSVSSSVLSQRPVARPRTKARQASHERTQAVDAGDVAEVVHHVQDDDVHSSTAGGQDNHNSQTAEKRETTDADAAQTGNTKESALEATNQETDHQQAVEEGDEYEDDYEDIIESENDSADDF